MYLTYYHGLDRVRKSTGLEDTAKNRKFIKNEVIPKLELELMFGTKQKSIPKFDHYAEIYLSEQVNRLKPHTFAKYKRILQNEILPFFGSSRMDEIKTTDVRIWVNRQLARVKPKTVSEKLCVLRAMFRYAYEDEVINRNPVDLIRLPEHEQPDVEPFTVDEVNLLINSANGWYRNYLAVSFYTGIRVGEQLALKWSDIDMNNRVLHIRRSISQGDETSPKTKGSVRKIPIFDVLWTYIQNQYTHTGLSNEYVFVVKTTGAPFYDATSIRDNYWLPLIKRVGIPHRQQKNTRHTFAVQMLNSGTMRITDISRLMGHTSTQMLITRYAKFIKSEEIKIDHKHDLFGLNLGTIENESLGKSLKLG